MLFAFRYLIVFEYAFSIKLFQTQYNTYADAAAFNGLEKKMGEETDHINCVHDFFLRYKRSSNLRIFPRVRRRRNSLPDALLAANRGRLRIPKLTR